MTILLTLALAQAASGDLLSVIEDLNARLEGPARVAETATAPPSTANPEPTEVPTTPAFPSPPVTYYANNVPLGEVVKYLVDLGYRVRLDPDISFSDKVSIAVRDGTVKDLCEEIARSLGVGYMLDLKNGVPEITFRKTIVLRFDVPIPLEQISTSQSVSSQGGSTGGGGATGTTGGRGSSGGLGLVAGSLSVEIKQAEVDFWKELKEALTAITTNDVQVLLVPSAGRVLVRAPVKDATVIRDYVADLIESRLRSVSVRISVIEVGRTENSGSGIDHRYHDDRGDLTISNPLTALLGAGSGDLVINTGNFSVGLELLKSSGKAKTLATPFLILMNRVPASVSRVESFPFLERVETQIVANVGTVTNPIFGTVTTGVRLRVYPVVLSEDQVLIDVMPIVSSISDFVTITDATGNSFSIPRVQERTTQSRMVLAKGQTGVIGGLTLHQIADEHRGLPGFHSTPLLSGKTARTEAVDLLVAVEVMDVKTPKIEVFVDPYGDNWVSQPSVQVSARTRPAVSAR
ncbi:MAG: hypothetical protein KatS3mg082_1467 [Nitrospiraceae bacterium]|nr:MAG: hypothetical protein KatS3mg082_1467 [Nitrospiraceae bacterium]